jgi:hypothetical protein
MKKDKEKVIDEVWTDDRVRSFLAVKSYDQVQEDFHMLLKAYQSMRASDFEKFVAYFDAEGRDLSARNPHHETVLDIVRQHNNSAEYADILVAAGAEGG